MSKNSFADKMNDSKLMLDAVKQNAERLARRGLDADFVTNYEGFFNESQTLNTEQEKMKADLKTKTEELQQKTHDLDALYSEAKKIVKIEMENSTWKEFGINDKR
jgi:phage shock protein A